MSYPYSDKNLILLEILKLVKRNVLTYIAYKPDFTNKTVQTVQFDTTLQNNQSITVLDFRVGSHARPDDIVYENNRKIWELIPRGLSFVLRDNNVISILSGVRKFGDDDNGKYGFKQDCDNDHDIIYYYTTKENGECFHIKVFKDLFDNITYVHCGSKQVHILLRLDNIVDDIKMYTEPRYSYATEMINLFLQKNYLTKNMISFSIDNDITYVGESITLEHSHLVEYKTDDIFIFAIVKYQSSDNGLCLYDPSITYNIVKRFGMNPITEIKKIDANNKEELANTDKYILNHPNSEGSVIYIQTKLGKIRCLIKRKSALYVAKRALREKLTSKASEKAIIYRLNNLHVKLDNLNSFIDKALAFRQYCMKNLDTEDKWKTINPNFVNLWNDFENLDSIKLAEYYSLIGSIGVTNKKLILATVGIPGCGKSTLQKILANLLNGIELCQDSVGGKANKYHEKLKEHIHMYNVVCCSKSHHNKQTRSALWNALGEENKDNGVYLVYYHPKDLENADSENPIENMADEAYLRILSRGLAHSTLFTSSCLDNVISTFSEAYENLDPLTENNILVIRVNIMDSLDVQINYILSELNKNNIYNNNIDNTKINESIKTVLDKENTLIENNSKNAKTIFWAIYYKFLMNILNNNEEIKKHMTDANNKLLAENKTYIYNTQFHSTLAFLGNVKDNQVIKETNDYYMPFENTKIDVKIIGIAYDDNAIALVTDIGNIKCNNAIPHITLGIAKDIKPVYSNELVAKGYINLTNPIIINGWISRHILIKK